MAEFHISADWVHGLAFDSDINTHTVRMDSVPNDEPGTGPTPKQMVLAALLACTGMDVVSLFNKMRVQYDEFRVEGTAPITAEHPKTFERVFIKYIVVGKDINPEKVEKAVNLSQTRYCAVSAMLEKHCPIEWEIVIESSVEELTA